MSIMVMRPPASTLDSARGYLGRLRAGAGLLTRGDLAASSDDDLRLSAPHPVFNLPFRHIGSKTAMRKTRMTGWRYFVLSGQRAVATMEFAATSRRDPGRFARLSDGRMAGSSARAIARAEVDVSLRDGQYVLGMLRVPALQIYALWLRDREQVERRDLFACVGPVPDGMARERWVSLDDFNDGLADVQSSAQGRAGFRP